MVEKMVGKKKVLWIYVGVWPLTFFLSFFFFLSKQVSVERGMSWEDATHIWAEHNGPDDGFYVQVRRHFLSILLGERLLLIHLTV